LQSSENALFCNPHLKPQTILCSCRFCWTMERRKP